MEWGELALIQNFYVPKNTCILDMQKMDVHLKHALFILSYRSKMKSLFQMQRDYAWSKAMSKWSSAFLCFPEVLLISIFIMHCWLTGFLNYLVMPFAASKTFSTWYSYLDSKNETERTNSPATSVKSRDSFVKETVLSLLNEVI